MTVLALTAAMVAGLAAPAYADTYYIGDGDITITKDNSGTHVQQGSSNVLDNEITIKGGKRSDDTTASGSGSSGTGTTGGTSATSPAKVKLTALTSEDSESEDMVYLGGTKGGSDENENQPDTTGGETLTKSTERSSSAPGSLFTFTGASLKVADTNDDDETKIQSAKIVETAIQNFKSTAENIATNVIQIINKVKDSTLNVTLDNVNIDVSHEHKDAALSVEGEGNTKITFEGSNTLTSGNQHAGLEHNEKSDGGKNTGKLTITSDTNDNGNNTGSLTATGNGSAAGIGSVWNISNAKDSGAGDIEITGGDITAKGDSDGAGIGSGCAATGETNITISGTAKIKARTDQGGTGIGSGFESTGKTTITISGKATVNAQSGSDGAGIGGGCDSDATNRNAGHGIHSGGDLTIETGSKIENAQGGDATDDNMNGGHGIYSLGKIEIKGDIETAQGGSGIAAGGAGIYSKGDLTISGGTIGSLGTDGETPDTTTGALGGTATLGAKGGHGIHSDGEINITDSKIGNAKGGEGKVFGSSSTVSHGIYSRDALTIKNSTIGNAQGGNGINYGGAGIETVVFSTESCTSTLSLSDIAALGAGSTPFTLSHSGSTATFTVGGADYTVLMR